MCIIQTAFSNYKAIKLKVNNKNINRRYCQMFEEITCESKKKIYCEF